MKLQSILTPERTLCGASGGSKKRILEIIAEFISSSVASIDTQEILNSLIARERLGSTGIGNGIAIPHCRLKNCPRVVGALITLQHKVDFDAIDGQPVDLLFALLVPEQATNEHLEILAGLAKLFSQQQFCETLRSAKDQQSLYQAAIEIAETQLE